MNAPYKIEEDGKRDNFTILPNMVDDMGLSPYAYRLYGHLKKVAGETGECWQSGDTMAMICKMSTGMVSKAKKELVKAQLIRVEVKATERNIYHLITIVDIWEKNKYSASPSPSEQPSPSEILPSPDEKLPSPGETNKNPINKNPIQEKIKDVPETHEEYMDLLKKYKDDEKLFLVGLVQTAGEYFKNKTQIKNVLKWREQYGAARVEKALEYYIMRGKTLDEALARMVTSIHKWREDIPEPAPGATTGGTNGGMYV